MGPRLLLRRLELEGDVSSLINEDVRPCDVSRRTWNPLAFHNYWLLINCTIATFLTGSSLIPLGLTWWQAIISISIGNLLVTGAIVLSSLQGANYHIGFSVYSRSIWGIWGSQFTIWNRIFLSFGEYGFQAWVGGQCVYLILLSWDPQYESRITNNIPAETGMTSARFVCYVIFCVVSLPFIWIRPHRLQGFFNVTSAVTFVFFLVLLIWALATMGTDGFGETLGSTQAAAPPADGPQSTAWLMVYGAMSTMGSIAAGILNQSDFSRLAKRPRDAIWGQVFSYPVYGIYASVLGILVVAATQNRFGGEPVWNPPTLFERLLERDDGAGTRAALFFAGVALCTSQLGSSIPGNALAGGIDLASIFPRYINIRRGAYITALISPVVNPWRLVSTAPIFLTVVSSYGVFLAPMTGMMTAHYLVVCKRKLKVEDLYRGDAGSIYWYWHGFNWRAVAAWIIGVAPCLPGFIASVNSAVKVSDATKELYYLNYLYGYFSSGIVYTALHQLFPARAIDDFVRQPMRAGDLQQYYRDQWDLDPSSDIIQNLLKGERADIGSAKERAPTTASSTA
ncbi:purine-cytosine permease family protein [Hirsutella rhossiliensis]|uniref:Permease for cytosine/purines, uracil, thiamine, allantoin n=1 Tax=Hirsutella rhossiliensis TaxID=111463 RepID=A0A9P8N846_9HYPO|nr:permease for cytosine/purines, uracil, thiamine, allantoin [Hirsutella rhossiliensis]KAH0967721.1 permease for cytosine/purines, uracil, thiamine, allantoin [Hirsutella rhossiliensis]